MFDDILKYHDWNEVQKYITPWAMKHSNLEPFIKSIKEYLVKHSLKYVQIGKTIDKFYINFDCGTTLFFNRKIKGEK